jgi:hypothetical protein
MLSHKFTVAGSLPMFENFNQIKKKFGVFQVMFLQLLELRKKGLQNCITSEKNIAFQNKCS